MTETKHIARGTDLTLIGAGVFMMVCALAWYLFGTGRYTPTAVGLAIAGAVFVVAGVAVVAAGRRR